MRFPAPAALALALAVGLAALGERAAARTRGLALEPRLPVLSALEPGAAAWLRAGVEQQQRYRLDEDRLSLLDGLLHPWRARPPPWLELWKIHADWMPRVELSWSAQSCDVPEAEPWNVVDAPITEQWRAPATFDALELPFSTSVAAFDFPTTRGYEPEPSDVGVSRGALCPRWSAPRPVTVVRIGPGNEHDRFVVLDCHGAIPADTLDRASVLGRSPGAPRPLLPLPIEPAGGAGPGEWVPGVRMFHPRLLWVLARVAAAFPARTLYLYSGYRPIGHTSLHRLGRAIDLAVHGVDQASLFGFCRSLSFVGCGYYPNHPFVHLDVRAYGTPPVSWVDASHPGEPSRYLDASPDAVERAPSDE